MRQPGLTESDVRRWTGEPSFDRGVKYFRQRCILNPRQQGKRLTARCVGSAPQPYFAEIMLGPLGIEGAECSCPVGGGGRCKHVAALLLTWVHEPGAFVEVEELEAVLEGRSKAELIALIRQMVTRCPDLETLLELPIAGREGGEPLSPEVIRRQVAQLFGSYGGWGGARGAGRQLEALAEMGDGYAAAGDWQSAAVIYETVARETLSNFGMFHDEEGELHGPVDRCVAGLGDCLTAVTDSAQREALLRVLFDIYRWDVEFGGIDMGYEAPHIILEEATAQELQLVAGWVRAALPGEGRSSEYRRQVWGGFLLDLEADQLDDDAFLRLCQETGRWGDLVDRLLSLDRVDEAAEVARGVRDYDLLLLTDLFAGHGQGELVEQLVRERRSESRDTRLTAWLVDRALEKGDLEEALQLREWLFWHRPDRTGYQEVKELAIPLGRWDALRVTVLARLEAEGQQALLTRIYLAEGNIDLAVEAVEKARAVPWGWDGDLPIRVAEAAETRRPQESIRIYRERIERLIAARGRGNYQMAVSHLGRVRELYRRLGEEPMWQALIDEIRVNNPRLRALKDELDRAGLR